MTPTTITIPLADYHDLLQAKANPNDEYDAFVTEFSLFPGSAGLVYCALALPGEAGEFADKLKKIIRSGDGDISNSGLKLTFDQRSALMHELGDVLWYVAAAGHQLGFTLQEIQDANVIKLRDRRSRGKIAVGEGDKR